MDATLAFVKWQLALVYLDDIVILSKTLEKHIDHVNQKQTILQHTGVPHELKKWFSFTDTIDYIGNVVRQRRLEISAHTADTI